MSSQGIRFREATFEDLRVIVELLSDDSLGQQREDLSDLTPYESAFRAIESDPNQQILLVESAGGVVGCVQISYLPNLTFKGGWRAQLEGVRMAQGYRGKGIGRQLILEAIERSRQRGCKIVQLTTNQVRSDAVHFYESLGFTASHIGMKLGL